MTAMKRPPVRERMRVIRCGIPVFLISTPSDLRRVHGCLNELTPHVLRHEGGTLKTICGSIPQVTIVEDFTSRLRLNISVFETLINLVL
jgi:hypothetical protein